MAPRNFIEAVKAGEFGTPVEGFREAFPDEPFSVAPEFQEKTPVFKLQNLGVDTQAIDDEVESDIEDSASKRITEDQLFERLDELSTRPESQGLTDDEIYDFGVEMLLDRGYTIEGIGTEQETQPTITTPEESPSALARGLSAVGGGAAATVGAASRFAGDTLAGIGTELIHETPVRILRAVNKYSPGRFLNTEEENRAAEALAESLVQSGIERADQYQEALGVDPESFAAQLGEGAANFGVAALTPSPTGKIKIGKDLAKGVGNLGKNAPKVLDALKNIARGVEETAKFEALTEGEVSPTSVAIGGALGGAIPAVSNIVKTKEPGAILRKITGLKPGQVKKLGTKTIKEDAKIGLKSIEESGEKIENRVDLFNALNKRQKDIYKKELLPLIEKAGKKGDVSISGLTDDILGKISPKLTTGKTTAEILGGKADEFSDIVDNFKTLEAQKLSFADLENLKLATSAMVREGGAKGNSLSFLRELDKRLGNKMDELLNDAVGTGAKKLKREYAAIANLKEPLYTKVAQEMRDSGQDIVSQFGLYSALQQAANFRFGDAAKSLVSVKTLEALRDPNRPVRELMRIIYGKEADTFLIDAIRKGSAPVAAEIGQALDR